MNDGSLRASDADRDKVVDVLDAAFAEGRITNEEHTERVQATLRAKTFDDLVPLTADLVPVVTPREPQQPTDAVVYGRPDEPDRMTAALSEIKRIGPWRVRRRSFATVFLGSVDLDLTEATFEAREIEINVTQFLGSVSIRVPRGVTVRDETARVLADTTIKDIGDPDPTFPIVVLRGTNVLGEIKIRGPRRPSIFKRAIT